MNKLWTTAIVFGLVILSTTVVVSAGQYANNDLTGLTQGSQYKMKNRPGNNQQVKSEATNTFDALDELAGDDTYNLQIEKQPAPENYRYLQKNQMKVKIMGVWGYDGSNETQGYLSGVAVKRERGWVFKAQWNTTDNSSTGKVIGIFKKGFFNGKLTTSEGKVMRITGLYKVDREEKTYKLKWMTAENSGWSIGKIITV